MLLCLRYEKQEVRTIGKKAEMRRVRRSADFIALVELASILINVLVYPVMLLVPDFAEGSFGAELADLVLYLIVFAVPVWIGAKADGMSLSELTGRGRPTPMVYLMTIGLTLGWSYAAGLMGTGIGELLRGFGLQEVSTAYVFPSSAAALFVQFLAVAIIPPVVEELCYRGLYLSASVRTMGTWGAIVLTSFAFWLAHYSIEILPLAFGFGLIGGYIRRRYHSLLPSMCGHFAVNSIYLIVNIVWAVGGDTIGGVVSFVIALVEIFFGAVGITLFVREGGLKEIQEQSFGIRSSLTPGQITRAVLTSVPVLVLLFMAIYMTAGNLKAV